jgi:riboflavin biosynthesis pyrimidine reductase
LVAVLDFGAFVLWRTTKRDTIESMDDPYLEVRISGREQPARIALTDGGPVQEELARFLNRQGPYAQMWIRLASGEYVRYDAIESVAPPPPA